MAVNLSGAPGVDVSIVDQSVLRNSAQKGIACVQGPTLRGIPGKPVFVSSWAEFVREFGGTFTGSDFPLLCRRALEAGARLYVSRLCHYTDVTDPSTVAGTKATATLTVTTNSAVFTAKAVGAGYNGTTVTVAAAASGNAGVVDITVTLPGTGGSQTLTEVSATPDANAVATFNAKSRYVDLGTVTNLIPVGSVSLATGAETVANIVDADYIGDPVGRTGLYAFSGVSGAARIANLGKHSPAVDIATLAYCAARQDMRAIISAPTGLNAQEIEDYRLGTGSYSHTAFNTYFGDMTGGGLRISHPDTGLEVTISEAGDVLGLYATKDTRGGEWRAAWGPQFGIIRNVLGVAYDLGTSADAGLLNRLSNIGVNMVRTHPTFGVMLGDGKTLLRAEQVLKFANVADLTVFMAGEMKRLAEGFLAQPNDPETWKRMFNAQSGFLDTLVAGRAIDSYVYNGDQDVDKIADVKYNTQEDVANGLYRFGVIFVPIVALRKISIELTLTATSADFTISETAA